MRPLLAGAVLLAAVAVPAAARADALADARRFYNQGQYDMAERAAREAVKSGPADGARVVLGRIQLERYRRSAAPADLDDARACLRAVDPAALDAQERVELQVGLAEALFLDEQFSAAAELFATVLDSSAALGAAAHERVLDWWATALDRHAQSRPVPDRTRDYERLLQRMTEAITKE